MVDNHFGSSCPVDHSAGIAGRGPCSREQGLGARAPGGKRAHARGPGRQTAEGQASASTAGKKRRRGRAPRAEGKVMKVMQAGCLHAYTQRRVYTHACTGACMRVGSVAQEPRVSAVLGRTAFNPKLMELTQDMRSACKHACMQACVVADSWAAAVSRFGMVRQQRASGT